MKLEEVFSFENSDSCVSCDDADYIILYINSYLSP